LGDEAGNNVTHDAFLQSLKGEKGDQGDPGVAFDDSRVITNKTWSSNKINSELSKKANTSSLATVATGGI